MNEQDQRISAWHRIVRHPAFKGTLDEDASLIDAMMERLDQLVKPPLPQEIEFSEIRAGDLIQVTRTYLDVGDVEETHVLIGCVVHQFASGSWASQSGVALARPNVPDFSETYRLLDRPVPPLPTEPGTVFRATEIRGVECNAIAFVREHGSEPTSRVYVTATLVNGFASHLAREITAWEPIEGVTK